MVKTTFDIGQQVRVKDGGRMATIKQWWQARTFGSTNIAKGARKYLVEFADGTTRYCMTKELERA